MPARRFLRRFAAVSFLEQDRDAISRLRRLTLHYRNGYI
jgi:hypothetical protein